MVLIILIPETASTLTLSISTFKNFERLDLNNSDDDVVIIDIKNILKLSDLDEIFIDGEENDSVQIQNLNLATKEVDFIEGNTTYTHYSYNQSNLYIEESIILSSI